MSKFRVYYTHRGGCVSTVLDGDNEQLARTAFAHHHPGTPIERVVELGARPAPAPAPARPSKSAQDDKSRRASEAEMAQVARALHGLRGHLAETAQPGGEPAPTCPECGGPAERAYGRHTGWFVGPLGCGHASVHQLSPKQLDRIAKREAALAALPPVMIPGQS